MSDVKERLAKEKEARDKAVAEAEKRMSSSKPTPTQDENDRARLGEDIEKHDDDGSGPEVVYTLQPKERESHESKEVKPHSSGSYQTRNVKPAT